MCNLGSGTMSCAKLSFQRSVIHYQVTSECNWEPGLEKSLVLPVLDRFLKLKTNLFLDRKLKNRSIKLRISQDFAIYTH